MKAGPPSWRLEWVVSCVVFVVWYAVGILLLATDWLPEDFGEMSKVWGDMVFLSLAAVVTLFFSARMCGIGPALRISAVILGVSAGAEMLGATTGFPFGAYQYTENLGPRLFGVMPMIIPLCWLTIVLNSFWIAVFLFQKHAAGNPTAKFLMIISAAFLSVLTDLNLEPVASSVKLYWIWFEPGVHYYGVPGFNFFGWMMISLVTMGIFIDFLPQNFRLPAIPWTSYALLASINLLFALINFRAGFHVPVFVALNTFGVLGIFLAIKETRIADSKAAISGQPSAAGQQQIEAGSKKQEA